MPDQGDQVDQALPPQVLTNIPPPANMEMQGDMAENWKFFKASWQNYEVATRLDQQPEAVRVATLLSVMGKDCFKTYQHLDMTAAERSSVEDILKKMGEHYEPQHNVIFERFKFNSCDQKDGEGIETYVARLRKLSSSCDYGNLTDEMIRDCIVLGIRSKDSEKDSSGNLL